MHAKLHLSATKFLILGGDHLRIDTHYPCTFKLDYASTVGLATIPCAPIHPKLSRVLYVGHMLNSTLLHISWLPFGCLKNEPKSENAQER
ncbi:hypothetical protein VNO77_19830 [Canavalia gladiata]|uniref:Uncharacterized protein n=1 Tax=Canavalia gladiata TaxID=3824 RepID=A0AAN9LS10_CANGL